MHHCGDGTYIFIKQGNSYFSSNKAAKKETEAFRADMKSFDGDKRSNDSSVW